MKNSDSNVYLYAKGWYKKTDVISDLKVIYGLRNGIDAEYISKNNILDCLLTLVHQHIRKDEYALREFISDISPNSFKRRFFKGSEEPYDFDVAVIEKCLSILSLVKVCDIPEGLDDVDPSVLPIAHSV